MDQQASSYLPSHYGSVPGRLQQHVFTDVDICNAQSLTYSLIYYRTNATHEATLSVVLQLFMQARASAITP